MLEVSNKARGAHWDFGQELGRDVMIQKLKTGVVCNNISSNNISHDLLHVSRTVEVRNVRRPVIADNFEFCKTPRHSKSMICNSTC